MQRIWPIFVALVVGAIATSNSAQARHYRYAELEPAYACGPIPSPSTFYIYPAANWEPFFRRHVYRYGPILACAPSTGTTGAISVRY
jgi:hypothetical protein